MDRHTTLFLDRDGVINVNHGYVHKCQFFDFIPGVFELTRATHIQHYKLVVITNQAGIARGYYSEQQFHDLAHWMCEQFKMQGAFISKVFFSPFHPADGIGKYKKDDLSRKPHPGMILQAQRELNLDLEYSILICDKASDIQEGITAGVGCNLLFVKDEPAELYNFGYKRITSLTNALPLLNSKMPQREAL
jgi:D-glycero-D-manno-heptose 1,7-bisphosphate phosphatase